MVNSGFAQETPCSNEGEIFPLGEGRYTDLVETTYDDPNWILVTSDAILRANLCVPSNWYEKVFNPCYDNSRYWKIAPGLVTGRAFPMSALSPILYYTLDSFYVREGFGFRLYTNLEEPEDPNDLEPASPYLGGAKYVSLTVWRDTYPAPDGFEPGTLFVSGVQGDLVNYSIIVCRYPLRLHKTHNADPNGVNQEDYVTYEISYENQPEGLSDPTDPNSGPQDTDNVIITDFLPLEMDFNSASNNGVYNSRLHTVTWNIGDLSIGDSGSVQLKVRVNRFAVPGSIITNYSEIKSDSLCAAAAVDVNVLHKPSICTLTKVDINAPNPVLPCDSITYEITYGPNGVDHNNVRIVDYLASEVDFTNLSDPNYNYSNHSYTLLIGSLSAGSPEASVTLTVKVNKLAEPNGIIINHCKIESDSSYTTATAETSVSPWQPYMPVIYVDNMAKRGSDTGMSWANAYLDLQDAFERAAYSYGSQIWVAEGTYKPTIPAEDPTFQLLDGVPIYGGFAGIETALSQRNWLTNETFLSGDWDNDDIVYDNSSYVVKASDVNQTSIIDGFTIMMGYYAGIFVDGGSPIIQHNKITENGYYDDCNGIGCGNHSSPTITDCNIQNNTGYGISSCDSEPNIISCVIKDNGKYGIYGQYSYYYNAGPNIVNCIIKSNGEDGIKLCDAAGGGAYPSGNLMVSNCIIEENIGNGIYAIDYSSVIVANSIIRSNGSYGIHYYYVWSGTTAKIKNNWLYNNNGGIYIEDDEGLVIIRNNTIVDNEDYGIRSINYYTAYNPDISSCIIWGNNGGQLLTNNPPFDSVTYSCIQNWTGGGTGNINTDPCFVNDPNDPNNYHLSPDSPCIDEGNTVLITDQNETDIDGEPRIFDGDFNSTDIVDMGADEFYWSPADFDRDELVNFLDYAVLAAAWLTDEPNVSLDDDNDVDMYDLSRFCDDWLWQPAWKHSPLFLMMMGSGYGQGAGFTENLYTAPPPCGELVEPTQQSQFQEESAAQQQACDDTAESVQTEPLEQISPEEIQQTIGFLQMLLSDEQSKQDMIELEGEQAWQEFSKLIEDWIEELNALL
jgi:hypothetical protein